MRKILQRFLKTGSLNLMSLVFSSLVVLGIVYFYMLIRLPNVSQLRDMRVQLPLRIYSSDGQLIEEFGDKKRIPVSIDSVPKPLVQAILDTEDQRFFEHRGVDFIGLLRAARVVIISGKKTQGASTITMQVARNFFLNREKTYIRKINEMLLAFRIDSNFTKQEILELYLNKIYFGQRAYGVAAAAQVYYGKSLDQLTLAEMAMLAGLPQAPSRDNPVTNPAGAKERRNHVLERMLINKHIDLSAYNSAVTASVKASPHEMRVSILAPYVAEMVRATLFEQFGEDIYDSGIKVYTTIDSRLQQAANQALFDGVVAYDRRHGYRGAEKHFAKSTQDQWVHELQKIAPINNLYPAITVNVTSNSVHVLLIDGQEVEIPIAGLAWATRNPKNILHVGDLVRVMKLSDNKWQLAQLPNIEGAIVALNPNNGAISALIGGFAYAHSSFNRAVQADRQVGSAFKPFVFSAALANGYTLASIVNDAPIVLSDPSTHSLWRPQNDSEQFYGPTRLRVGLVESRNLAAIRLLQQIGIPYTIEYLQRFGFDAKELPPSPSLALGTAAISPLKLTSGFAVFANGGYRITPYFITSVVNGKNEVIFQGKPSVITDNPEQVGENGVVAPRVISAQNTYLMTNVLQDVINFGTARKASLLNRRDLAGKTGTSNNGADTWFAGFNSDIVATVWMGFDRPRATYEHGAQAALPVWIDFMATVLAGKPEHSMLRPDGIVAASIDPGTGLLAQPGQANAISEIFTSDTVPSAVSPNVDDDNEADVDGGPLF